MVVARVRRRVLLYIGLFAVLAAIGSNLYIFLGIAKVDVKTQLGDVRKSLDKELGDVKNGLGKVKDGLGDFRENLGELKHDLGAVRIPGIRKKPWHSGEKPGAILEPVDNHPISGLMQEADKEFRKYENARSTSYQDALRIYRRRYGRHPPPGFTEWYKYARKRGVHNIDDFEQIMDDLRPFWAIEPNVIRKLAANMWRNEDMGISGIHIRDHKVLKESNGNWRSETLVTLIKKFVKYLPDMDIAINRLDQPRVIVPWDDMQTLLQNESESRRMPPKATDSYTPNMTDLYVESDHVTAEEEKPGWFPAHGQQYMDFAALACPPESPARQNGSSPADAESMYKNRLGGLVMNFNRSTDLCVVGPQIKDLHGLLFSSSSMIPTHRLVPVFGECKVNINSDILFPANMYWKHDDRYDYNSKGDAQWEKKKDVMIWRGVTSGGTQNPDNWQKMHRQRLVMAVNSTEVTDKQVRILTAQPEKQGDYENYREFHPASMAQDHTDVGFTETWGCVPDDCSFYKDVWTLKESVPLPDQFKNKFLIDVDGHSFSGRWIAFLESKSLALKATIFREWFDSRLFAWHHFVPVDNRYDDIYTLLTYFLGVGSPPEEQSLGDGGSKKSKAYVTSHDAEGKRIAEQGREWAKKVLRRDDIEIYMYRLLLEYARIIDDNRDRIGYSGDGSELNSWDGVST